MKTVQETAAAAAAQKSEVLLEVKGIGEATLEKLRQEVTVGEETDNTQEDTVP